MTLDFPIFHQICDARRNSHHLGVHESGKLARCLAQGWASGGRQKWSPPRLGGGQATHLAGEHDQRMVQVRSIQNTIICIILL